MSNAEIERKVMADVETLIIKGFAEQGVECPLVPKLRKRMKSKHRRHIRRRD